jgi:NCAIR mutase (PurE)-related protein
MDASELKSLLEAVSHHDLSPEEALKRLRWRPTVEAAGDFAHVDLHRRLRCGFPEVIFGQGKSPEQIAGILRTFQRHGEGGLATRIDAETAAYLEREFPEGVYNRLGRTFQIRVAAEPDAPIKVGKVVIVTAGTSDLPVAEEARVTAEAWGCEVVLVADVGVAGIHRLFHRLDSLHGADAIVVVAGMEGALPSVVGGLVDCPVVGVPTSVGYGAHFGGLAALLGMLNSCASNVAVTNIDGGFNGGHYAGLIARRAGLARAGTALPVEGPP